MNPVEQLRKRMAEDLAISIIMRLYATKNRVEFIRRLKIGLDIESGRNREFVIAVLNILKQKLPNDNDICEIHLG